MEQINYTNPGIRNSKDLKTKAYVEFYYNNSLIKEYTGECLGLRIFPDKAKSVAERTVLLNQLRREIKAALITGTYTNPAQVLQRPPLQVTLVSALKMKLSGQLSLTYKRDLTYIHNQFLEFLSDAEMMKPLDLIPTSRVEEFLSKFNSSNTYYMHKRTDLAALFSAAGRTLNLKLDAVIKTERKKPKAKLNWPFEPEQVKPLLNYIKQVHPNLYICCMLTYGTWLRPHVEIRNLTRRHFSNDYSQIKLSGEENKSGRVRVVYVPHYAQETLKEILQGLEPDQNIFTGQVAPLNPDYFKTAWSRMKSNLKGEDKELIKPNQSLYSFRHTAAIQAYQKTKDIELLQKLLGHQSIVITQKYLRGLGLHDMQILIDNAPEL